MFGGRLSGANIVRDYVCLTLVNPGFFGLVKISRGGGGSLSPPPPPLLRYRYLTNHWGFFDDFWQVVRLKYKEHFDYKKYFGITIVILLMSAFLSISTIA